VQGALISHWREIPARLEQIQPVIFLINLLQALSGVIIYALASSSVGYFFLHVSVKENESRNWPSEASKYALLVTCYLLGQLVLSIFFLVWGALGQITPFLAWLTIALSLILGGRQLINVCITPILTGVPEQIKELQKIKVFPLLLLAILTLFSGLILSNSRLGYDATALYFSSAKLVAITRHVQYFQADSFIVSAFQTGIHHSILIMMFGDEAARMHSWISGTVLIIFVIELGKKAGLSRQASVYLLILASTSTVFLDVLGDGKVDLASSAPALAAIYWLPLDKKAPSSRRLILIGTLAGFAMISRPHNIFLLGLVLGIYYLGYIIKLKAYQDRSQINQIFRQFLIIVTPVIFLMVFHLLINWLTLGDPLAPLADIQKVNRQDWQWRVDPNEMWVLRLLYPFVVTFYNNSQSGGNITPLFIAFLPALFLKTSWEKLTRNNSLFLILVASLLTLFLWVTFIFTVVEIRYVLFIWLVLYIPVAIGIDSLMETKDNFIRSFANIILVVLLIYSSLRIIYITIDTFSPIDSHGNATCRNLAYCEMLIPINQVAPTGERVLALSAYRYYLRSDLLACSSKGTEYDSLRIAAAKGTNGFWEEVYRQGYSFLAFEEHYSVHRLFIEMEPRPENTPAWLKLIPLYGTPGDALVTYEIIADAPPIPKEKICRVNENGQFEVQEVPNK
jgi:hypothetical protein